MSLLKIRYYPDAVLKAKAKKITIFDSSVRKLAQDMLDTMYENDGVGLAAPQVGVSKRMMVIDVSGEEETPRPIVFINPEIIERDGEMTGQEGCLSFPDVFFEVKRASKVVVKFQNLKGQTLKLTADGNLLSRAIQHEIDHLDGELFIDRAVSQLKADLEMTKAGFREGDVAELEREVELEKEAQTISLTQTANQPVAL
ncbi:MAG: peptide deformylase [Candidatus Melainabacteria bacterium]|jgi:peptide deformylase|nr:peptide deformylase [Candidatus Melainabacteria bacterium]